MTAAVPQGWEGWPDTAKALLREQLASARAVKRVDGWRHMARPEQIPPSEPWRIIFLRGGRGGGKTWSGAHILAEEIVHGEPGQWAVIAPTFADARDTCVEGDGSGLLAAFGTSRAEVDAGRSALVAKWNRSIGELRLRSGSVVFIDGADDGAYRIQGKNLRGCWCVAAGEPILTRDGEVLIEDVQAGDEVWTRHGWRPVLRSGLTRRAAETVRIQTSERQTLRLTSEHKVWTEEHGWTRAGDLLPGMTLLTPSPAHPPTTNGRASAGIADLRAGTTRTAPDACSTSPCGNERTDGACPTGTSSTTAITTRRTTASATLSASPAESTSTSMACSDVPTQPRFARSSAQRRRHRGLLAYLGIGRARTAARPTSRPGSAPSSAAPSAVLPTRVTGVERSGRADVYDLTVADAHEFVAGGILVHNCDEIGLWKRWKTAWDESIAFAVRKAPARIIATGTPKRLLPARELIKRLLEDTSIVHRRLRTKDNADNLDAEALARLLASEGTALGQQELEGELLEVGGLMFDVTKIDRVADWPRQAKLCRYWDLAATEASEKGDPDWTVGLLIALWQGQWTVIDVHRLQGNPGAVRRAIEHVRDEDRNLPGLLTRMEQEPGSSGKTVTDTYAREVFTGLRFKGLRSTGSKLVRAEPVAHAVDAGNLSVIDAPWTDAFLEELEIFPDGSHDDQVDALSGAFGELAIAPGPARIRVPRRPIPGMR